MFLLYIVTNLLAFFGILFLILLLVSKRGFKQHFWFIIFSISLMLWVGLQFVAQLLSEYSVSTYLVKAAIGVVTVVSVSFYGFVDNFIDKKTNHISKKLLLLISVTFLCLSATNLIAKEVSISLEGIAINSIGLLYPVLLFFCVALVAVSLYRLIKKYRISKDVDTKIRSGIKLLFYGMLQFVLIITFASVFLSKNKFSQILAPLASLVLVLLVFYAIFKHSLFNIRGFIARSLAYSFTVLIVIVVYIFILFSTTRVIFGLRIELFAELYFSFLTVLAALTFQPLIRYFNRFSNKIFYRDAYSMREVLDKLSDSLLSESDIDSMMHQSLYILENALKPESAYLAVLNKNGIIYKHINTNSKEKPACIPVLLNRIHEEKKNLINREEEPSNVIAKIMAKDNIEVLLRLGPRKSPTGLLLLGEKQNGTMYTKRDIDLLQISAKNLGVALDNAKKYEQILHFADTLHKEVRQATGRLKKANTELKTLDTLKDDFIAAASHQLRTPSASVHDAIRMLNQPGLTKKERDELVDLAEASSEHLVTVVKTILNMARIQAGRFKIDKSEADLTKIADSVLSRVEMVAQAKDSKIEYNKPDHSMMAFVDVAEITEALTNYLENAVKYSPKGSVINLNLTEANDKVFFEVTDKGIGVPESERKNLFGKFFRASNAREEEPDGNGIGLYVVKSAIEGHGGEAYYRPGNPHGSVFGFWLPTN